jgi:peptide/nickel transport system substrate-binding protein
MKKLGTSLLGAVVLAAVAGPAWSETLTIGVRVETSSVDPHFFNSPPNRQISDHIFNRLVRRDANERLQPDLAESWKPVGDKTWEFKLRKDAKWQDGSPVTVDDFLFTVERSPNVPGSASTPGRFYKNKTFKKIDDHTVHIMTDKPYPLMPNDMSVAHIISLKHGKGTTTKDYNSGKGTVGSGPYKFVEWVPGDRLVMVKDPNYWGAKAKWDKVVYKPIKSDPSRVAALLSGAVDLIDFVPTQDAPDLKSNPKIKVWSGPSNRIIHMWPNVGRSVVDEVTDNAGKPLVPNPIRDWRVRKAISMAIDRNAIVDRVMQGSAIVAGQMIPPGNHGHNPAIKAEAFDPEAAKKLLAEAGYPDGFQVLINGPNDRYVNDAKIVETIAGFLVRIGIRAKVNTMPKSVYFSRMGKGNYGLALMGYGSDTGDGSSALNNMMHSPSKGLGLGAVNRGYYANRTVDELTQKALYELDQGKREKLLFQAYGESMKDLGTIPLHWQVNVWASRPGIRYEARKDEQTVAEGAFKE